MSKLGKTGKIILILIGILLFLVGTIIAIVLNCLPPDIYYYYFDFNKSKTIEVKATHYSVDLPKQYLEGWEFKGYTDQYLPDTKNYKTSYNLHYGKYWYNAVFSKKYATIELKDNVESYSFSFNEVLSITSSGEVYYARIESDFIEQLVQLYSEDVAFEGIYDEIDGGECLINEEFKVCVDLSQFFNRTLYVHRKQVNVNLLDINSDIKYAVNLTYADKMPELSVNIPSNHSLVGWKIQNTNEIITNENKYLEGYEILNSKKYAEALISGTLTLVPVIEHNDVEFHYGDTVIDCEYGKFLDFIPQSDNEHIVFCGWRYQNGKLFDGFVTDDMNIVPIWMGKNYRFKFDLNGGECDEDLSKIYYNYGEEIIALPNAITKEGYEFLGWFSSPDNDAFQYSNGVGVLIGDYSRFAENNYIIQNDTVTLYAHYTSKSN